MVRVWREHSPAPTAETVHKHTPRSPDTLDVTVVAPAADGLSTATAAGGRHHSPEFPIAQTRLWCAGYRPRSTADRCVLRVRGSPKCAELAPEQAKLVLKETDQCTDTSDD